MTDNYQAPPFSSDFIWRRAHSFTGIWLVLFLLEHLFTNSQAALFIGDDGNAFVKSVNSLKNLPYLPIIEIILLGIPFLIHGLWGIKYLFSAKMNSFPTDGSTPSLPMYSRNRAYSWQRITSWILLFGIIAHVIQMRFLEYPNSSSKGQETHYMIPVSFDKGLYTLSKRLNFEMYDEDQINKMTIPNQLTLSPESSADQLIKSQTIEEERNWITALQKRKLKTNQTMAVTNSFGTAELLMVRDTFKSPLMIILYTGLVLAACFHAFNGLWTAMITWGITLTVSSQNLMRKFAIGLMVMLTALGLSAIWGTYWLNLYQ